MNAILMGKRSRSYELDRIQDALADFPQGASIQQLLEKSRLDLNIRTLQRRLAELQSQQVVMTAGTGKSTVYILLNKKEAPAQKAPAEISQIPLSKEGEDVLKFVTRPAEQRTPVPFHREFLENYEPNKTTYLSAKEKSALAELSKTNEINHPAGTYAKKVLNRLLIDLSWNSSRLEGNTYSLLDTERLIDAGREAENKPATDAQMILNHKDAIEFIVNHAEEIRFDKYTILSLHSLLSDNLLPNPAASGRLRDHAVGIYDSVYSPPALPQVIDEMFAMVLSKASAIEDPFEQAFFIMVQLPYLQPFDDVNKRVSRIAANIPLVKRNLSPLSFVDVPGSLYISGLLGVYELNRVELLKDVFMWAYERSAKRYAAIRQTLGEPDQFKLRYRSHIRTVINEIIKQGLSSTLAGKHIRKYADKLPQDDQGRFVEVIESELLSLHEGNFARYYISPTEFNSWKERWKRYD
jgi:hypothetical protein